MSYHDSSLTVRLTVVGSKTSGKSTLVKKYIGGTLDIYGSSKCTNSSYIKDTMLEGTLITQHILDSDGKNTATLSWSHGVIIVFAVDKKDSLKEVEEYILQTRQLTMRNANIMIVANKIDLQDRAISMEEGQRLALKHNCDYIETSAIHDQSKVKSIFYQLSHSIISQRSIKQRTRSPTMVKRLFDSVLHQTEKCGNRIRRASIF